MTSPITATARDDLTSAQQLQALADRVEAAEKPDRGLDAAIWWRVTDGEASSELVSAFEADAAVEWDRISGPAWRKSDRIVRCYTASLDAAMTLVPGSVGWYVASGSRWAAGCGNDTSLGEGAEAATPALALTAAALRARAVMMELLHGTTEGV